MATKRRRLKTKKKNNRKTKKVGGVNPFKSLGNIIDNAADKFITPEAARGLAGLSENPDNIEMKSLQQSSAATTPSTLPKDESLDEIKMQFPQRNPNRRKSPKILPSLNQSPDEDIYDLLDKVDNNTNIISSEKESEPKLADIAEVAGKVSLAVRNVAESMKVEKEGESLVNAEEVNVDESEEDVSETEGEENEPTQEELAEKVKDAEKQQSNAVDNANISLLGVAASNVADAIANILKTNEVEGAVIPMPSVVTPPVLPNSVDDSENLSLVLRNPNPKIQDALPVVRNPVALKAKTVVGETKGECPSADIEITEEDGAFSFKGMNEPINNKDCKKNSWQLHPDRNLGCSDEAKVKIQNLNQFCNKFQDSDKNSAATDEEIDKVTNELNKMHEDAKNLINQVNTSNKEQLKKIIDDDAVERLNSQIDEYRKSQRYDNNESIKDLISQIETELKELTKAIEEAKKRLDYHRDADKIKQIKEVVNPAIETLLFKSSDQLRKQVTDYKKYTELLANYHPDSISGGQGLLAAARGVYALGKFVKKKHDNSVERKKAEHKTKMAELAKNVMENGFIIGIERPVDDETYKVYEYSNYKIFEDELKKSTEPDAETVLADFKENEMKYKNALGKLTRNEKLRRIVDYIDRFEGDTTGGSTIIRNYAIHTMKGTVSEIIERYKGNGYIREIGIGLKREIIPILNTNKQLSNSDYIKYLALKNLFEWLKPKYVLYQYKLEGEPLFNSFGEDFIKKTFSDRMKNLEYSIDALINKKIISYDPVSDNGLIDNLKCYKKGKPKCNEIEYLELEKFPEQLKSLILTDENSSTAPQYKEISELAKVILADYTKKYAKKYTRKNQPKPVIIRPKFDVAIGSDLNMIGYDKVKIPNPTPIAITINKTGLTINNEIVDTKDKWDAVRQLYLGYGKSQDDFKLPTYTNGELRFIIDTQAQKMAVYINKDKEILINNMKQLEELKSALNKV